ncbi:MAG: hypothetical protein IJ849_02515 [Selenomonadaceae bacterium]|nr:hypothetical protein [Selenomonadaceae bacterium]
MEEERDIAQNIATAFREVKDIINGKAQGITWAELEQEILQWENEADVTQEAVAV